jgi:hypothetical protein
VNDGGKAAFRKLGSMSGFYVKQGSKTWFTWHMTLRGRALGVIALEDRVLMKLGSRAML